MKKIIALAFVLAGLFITSQVIAQTETKTGQARQTTEKKEATKTGKESVKAGQEVQTAPAKATDTKPRPATKPATEATPAVKPQPMTKPATEAAPSTKPATRPETGKDATISTGKTGTVIKSETTPETGTAAPAKTREVQTDPPASTRISVTKDASGKDTKLDVPQDTKKDGVIDSKNPEKK